MEFPDSYGQRPPWHDIQAEVRGPAVHDLEHTFRERWYGSSVLDLPSPVRQLYDRAYHMGAMTSRPLPEPSGDDSTRRGPHAVQVLRTYPARLRRYPFAPLGERSIAYAYRKALARARRLRLPGGPVHVVTAGGRASSPRPSGTGPTCTSSLSCRATRTTTARSPGCRD